MKRISNPSAVIVGYVIAEQENVNVLPGSLGQLANEAHVPMIVQEMDCVSVFKIILS